MCSLLFVCSSLLYLSVLFCRSMHSSFPAYKKGCQLFPQFWNEMRYTLCLKKRQCCSTLYIVYRFLLQKRLKFENFAQFSCCVVLMVRITDDYSRLRALMRALSLNGVGNYRPIVSLLNRFSRAMPLTLSFLSLAPTNAATVRYALKSSLCRCTHPTHKLFI